MSSSFSTEVRASLDSGDIAKVLLSLSDLALLEEACRASIQELLSTFGYVLRQASRPLPADASLTHPSGALIDRTTVSIIESTLIFFQDELKKRPPQLFSYLYEQLYWYDAPERANHEENLTPSTRSLWKLMEHWRASFETRPNTLWLRSLRPPASTVANMPFLSIPGREHIFFPDGGLVLCDSGYFPLEKIFYDVKTVQKLRSLPCEAVALSPDGRLLLARDKFSAQLFSIIREPGNFSLLLHHTFGQGLYGLGEVHSWLSFILFSDNQQEVITSSYREVNVWRHDGSLIASHAPGDAIHHLFACGEDRLLIQHKKGLTLWDYKQDRILWQKTSSALYQPEVTAISPQRDRLITYTGDTSVDKKAVEGWALPEGKRLFRYDKFGDAPVAFHRSGAFFARGSALRDSTSGEVLQELPGAATYPSFDPTGRFLFCGSDKKGSFLWDVEAKEMCAVSPVSSRAAQWSQDGRTLCASGKIIALDGMHRSNYLRDDAHNAKGWIRFSQSGDTVVTNYEGGLLFWDINTGTLKKTIEAELIEHRYYFLDNNRVVICAQSGVLAAFRVEDGQELFTLSEPGDTFRSLSASPACRTFLTQTKSGKIIACSLDTGEVRYWLPGNLLEQHLQGSLFVTRVKADSVSVRDIDTAEERVVIPEGVGKYFCVSPDGRWLAVSRLPRSTEIELWELSSKQKRSLGVSGDPESHSVTSIWFREDSAVLFATTQETTDLDSRDNYFEDSWEVATGKLLTSSQTASLHTWMSFPSPRQLAPNLRFVNEDGLYLNDKMAIETPHLDNCNIRRGEVFFAQGYGRFRLYQLRGGAYKE